MRFQKTKRRKETETEMMELERQRERLRQRERSREREHFEFMRERLQDVIRIDYEREGDTLRNEKEWERKRDKRENNRERKIETLIVCKRERERQRYSEWQLPVGYSLPYVVRETETEKERKCVWVHQLSHFESPLHWIVLQVLDFFHLVSSY